MGLGWGRRAGRFSWVRKAMAAAGHGSRLMSMPYGHGRAATCCACEGIWTHRAHCPSWSPRRCASLLASFASCGAAKWKCRHAAGPVASPIQAAHSLACTSCAYITSAGLLPETPIYLGRALVKVALHPRAAGLLSRGAIVLSRLSLYAS